MKPSEEIKADAIAIATMFNGTCLSADMYENNSFLFITNKHIYKISYNKENENYIVSKHVANGESMEQIAFIEFPFEPEPNNQKIWLAAVKLFDLIDTIQDQKMIISQFQKSAACRS